MVALCLEAQVTRACLAKAMMREAEQAAPCRNETPRNLEVSRPSRIKPLFARQQPPRHRTVRDSGSPSLPLYAMLFAMQLARSMFIVVMSWLALQITGEMASVGQILICWQFLAFSAGPFIGPLLDRFQHRNVFALGEVIHGTGVAFLAAIIFVRLPLHPPIAVLYGAASTISVGSLLSYPASQALLQQAAAGPLVRTVSQAMIGAQIGNIAGATLGGLCLVLLGVSGSLALCAASSFFAVGFASLLKREERATRGKPEHRHRQDLIQGMMETIANPRLKLAACALLLAYASAHASNALLASFTRSELKLSADQYGWIAAMYSAGGLVGSITVAAFNTSVKETTLISLGCVVLAGATAALSTSHGLAEAVFWQGLVGLSFMMIRVGADVTVLETAPNWMIGRIRSNIDAAIGLVAILIYLLPGLANEADAGQILLGLSGLFACGGCAVLWLQRSAAFKAVAQGSSVVEATRLSATFATGAFKDGSRTELLKFSKHPKPDAIACCRPASRDNLRQGGHQKYSP